MVELNSRGEADAFMVTDKIEKYVGLCRSMGVLVPWIELGRSMQ